MHDRFKELQSAQSHTALMNERKANAEQWCSAIDALRAADAMALAEAAELLREASCCMGLDAVDVVQRIDAWLERHAR